MGEGGIILRIDDDGSGVGFVSECDETNNQDQWLGLVQLSAVRPGVRGRGGSVLRPEAAWRMPVQRVASLVLVGSAAALSAGCGADRASAASPMVRLHAGPG